MILVKEIFNNRNCSKWEILQDEEDSNKYYLDYYEFFCQSGWQLISRDIVTKDYIEASFNISLDDLNGEG